MILNKFLSMKSSTIMEKFNNFMWIHNAVLKGQPCLKAAISSQYGLPSNTRFFATINLIRHGIKFIQPHIHTAMHCFQLTSKILQIFFDFRGILFNSFQRDKFLSQRIQILRWTFTFQFFDTNFQSCLVLFDNLQLLLEFDYKTINIFLLRSVLDVAANGEANGSIVASIAFGIENDFIVAGMF